MTSIVLAAGWPKLALRRNSELTLLGSVLALGVMLLIFPFSVAEQRTVLAVPVVMAAFIDMRTRRIPNALTLGLLVVGLALAADGRLLSGSAGALAAGVIAVFIYIAGRGAFGMGDVKLMAACGALLGIRWTLPFMLAMSIAGGAIAMACIAAGALRARDSMPYGPAIAAGYVVTLFLAA